MKQITWRKDGMKQIIDTGHRTFDKQLVVASTGNVIGGGQYSTYVRPYTETECNGHTFAPGHLQNADFNFFGNTSCRVPQHVRDYVQKVAQDKQVILYNFHHHNYTRHGYNTIVHGWIITDPSHNLIKYFITGPTYKSYDVIKGVLPYICNDEKNVS